MDRIKLRELTSDVMGKQKVYESSLEQLTLYLESISPMDFNWYSMGKGFVRVDVESEYIDMYLAFVESLVDCKYTYNDNLNGISLLLSVSTLYEECLK